MLSRSLSHINGQQKKIKMALFFFFWNIKLLNLTKWHQRDLMDFADADVSLWSSE